MTSEEIVKDLRCESGRPLLLHEAATLIESQAQTIAELTTKLAYAEDAAAKGGLARQNASGMEMEIAELQEQLKNLAYNFAHAEMDNAELQKDKARLETLANLVWESRWASKENDYQEMVGIVAEIRSGNFNGIDAVITKGEKR